MIRRAWLVAVTMALGGMAGLWAGCGGGNDNSTSAATTALFSR